MGIPRKIIRIIRACVHGKCKVKYEGEESEEFDVGTGLRQGNALSPNLFNITLESVIRETFVGATGIKIRYANKIIIIIIIIQAESEEDLKKTTGKLIEEGEKIGIMVNEEKHKVQNSHKTQS